MKLQTLYQYYVTANGRGCWVCGVDDSDTIKKACAKLGLDFKSSAAGMHAYRIGKAGVQTTVAEG